MKTGKKIPIPKRYKSPVLMTNHRGITITSNIGKYYEHAILGSFGKIDQSGLQFGFTKDLCPQMATIFVTELIAEAKSEGYPSFASRL